MAPRTTTSHLSTISFAPGGNLSYPVPPSVTSRTSVSIQPGSTFDSGLHWHESYTEYFCVAQGVLELFLEDQHGSLITSYIGPGSGIIEVAKGRRHRLRRGDRGAGWQEWMDGVEFKEGGKIEREQWDSVVKAEEWTSPADGRKEAFFRNVAGVVTEPQRGGLWSIWGGVMVLLGVFTLMREFDNWPAFLGGRFRTAEWMVSHGVLAAASWVGSLVGLKAEYEEYTPKELRKATLKGEGRKDL